MMDGRRHSVDIPISKALLALRRVRSLRDPSTNSLSKFYSENRNWETKSNDGISLKFICPLEVLGKNSLHGTKKVIRNGEKQECASDCGLHEITEVKGLDYCRTSERETCGSMCLSERYSVDPREKDRDLTPVTPGNSVDLCNNLNAGLFSIRKKNRSPSMRLLKHKYTGIRTSNLVGDVPNGVDSSCLSQSSLFEDEWIDGDDNRNHHGCGIKCCWSKTPIFKDRGINYMSDIEYSPLLSGQVSETGPLGLSRSLTTIRNKTTESPRSLSQKFRPRSFGELVGQSVVAKSLLNTITKRSVTPLYLFHGPRGTGKTSASRIFSAALNCLSFNDEGPCGMCQECVMFFNGMCKDVKEVNSMSINGIGRVRTLMKNAFTPPVKSRYKIFIFDECQLLSGETWVAIVSSLEELPQHIVFIMITADLERLPKDVVSQSQRYHFPRINDVDVASRLGKICVEEGIDIDQIALDLVASKSSGSLRDAEMMLEQLSLLGKRITISLAHELIGIVSDDELLDLLYLALSSDIKSTVRRARELMSSRIDPLQLVSQLSNLIMDILAEKNQDGGIEDKKFSGRSNSEADLQKLSHALKVLSETEKQLKTSKYQTTWLTVALLQLCSTEASSLDTNDSQICLGTEGQIGNSEPLVTGTCNNNMLHKPGIQDNCKETLESIWSRATEICESHSFRRFLKNGRLSSIYANQGIAIAELEFCHLDHVASAEKSWKLIASLLQSILNCNVEIRISLAQFAPVSKVSIVKKLSSTLFNCCHKTQSIKEMATIGDGEGNALGTEIGLPVGLTQDIDSVKEAQCGSTCQLLNKSSRLPNTFESFVGSPTVQQA